MSELNEDKIKERLEVLENDIKRVSEQMVSLDKQKSDAIAMLNALNGAKQQCQSFLNDLNNDDQPSGQEVLNDTSESDDS
tara:strand:+ start:406 stop:645 length:240 start_codon:yes stop_codon:yes gene_type:complete